MTRKMPPKSILDAYRPTQELDARAKAYAKDHGIPLIEAYKPAFVEWQREEYEKCGPFVPKEEHGRK